MDCVSGHNFTTNSIEQMKFVDLNNLGYEKNQVMNPLKKRNHQKTKQ
jgi:hypothetical protein